MGTILIVEDRDPLRRMLAAALGQEGHQTVAVATGEAALDALERRDLDLVLTDLKLPGISGLEVLAASRRCQPAAPVIVMTAHGTVGAAVEAMKHGAVDFLEKPVEIEDLSRLVAAHLGGREEAAIVDVPGAPVIVGRHPLFRAAVKLLRRVAPTESTVLLTGESGTGKELFARALHALSPRTEGPFVAVNCAAIPEALIENELFGHEKGAFTGAHRRQPGRFEQARGGTVFLDEVGELGAGVQSKVLRVLEERTFERVGGGATIQADVRLVAATNRPLERMVEEGTFRSDLYFRLEVFPIELPPLRDRPSDAVLIARHLLGGLARRHGRPELALSAGAERLLAEQPWPGNVRQLSNLLERAVILADGPRLGAADLESLLAAGGGRDETARAELCAALDRAGGDRHKAAELLGVSVRTLQRRIKRHELEGYPDYRDSP